MGKKLHIVFTVLLITIFSIVKGGDGGHALRQNILPAINGTSFLQDASAHHTSLKGKRPVKIKSFIRIKALNNYVLHSPPVFVLFTPAVFIKEKHTPVYNSFIAVRFEGTRSLRGPPAVMA